MNPKMNGFNFAGGPADDAGGVNRLIFCPTGRRNVYFNSMGFTP